MADHKLIQISANKRQFSAITQGKGPLVLLLHGFPDNKYTYKFQLPALAKAGYTAVSVSLRGYETSSQADDNDYEIQSLVDDVIAILNSFDAQDAHLVGHDWGAAIAYTTCSRVPCRFRSLTSLGLPHNGRFLNEAIMSAKQLRLSWYMFFFQFGNLAVRAVQKNDYKFIRNLWQNWCAEGGVPYAHVESVIETIKQPGVLKAALQYYRTAISVGSFSPQSRALNRFQVNIPSLVVSGGQDGCIDSSTFARMMRKTDFPQGLDFRCIESVGHFPHIEAADTVNEWLLAWINKWQPSA